MTAEATAPKSSLKASVTWSALTIVVAGVLWAVLYQQALTFVGFLIFVAIAVLLIAGTRTPGASKVLPPVLLVGTLAAVVILRVLA